jgi:hypothetical protein
MHLSSGIVVVNVDGHPGISLHLSGHTKRLFLVDGETIEKRPMRYVLDFSTMKKKELRSEKYMQVQL